MMRSGDSEGYDRSLTMFNPEGRLFQVEYAREAVKRGTLALGLKSNKAACIITYKKLMKLMEPESLQKIYMLDDHVGCCIAGLHADSRILVDYTRVQCQIHRLSYGEPVRMNTIVRKIADIMQQYTQYGGVRPFGSSLMLIGIDPDKQLRLAVTDPSGIYKFWKGMAVGRNSEDAKNRLEQDLKDDMDLNAIITLGVKILKELVEDPITADILQVAVISIDDPKFKILSEEECKKFL